MASIKLNFLPLKKSKFEFSIYRRPKQDTDIKTDELFFYRLTENPGDKERKQYAVSFNHFEGAAQLTISSYESIDLTKRYLLNSLLASLLAKETTYSFEVRHRFAVHQVDFTIEEVPEGKKVIYLSPYFLEDQSKFGYIIDYKFAKAADVLFDKAIQLYSLSLDSQYRSNRNFYADKFHLLANFIEKSYKDWQFLPGSNGDIIEVTNYLNESPAFSLSKKEYIFNNNNVAYSQFQGIKNYGPYRKLDQEVIFVFLFEERFKSFANELYLSLFGKSNPGTFPGFEAVFKLKINVQNVKQVRLENYEPQNLSLAVDKVKAFQEPGKQVIGIYLEDYDQDKGGEASATYYFLKYKFIKESIPLQVANYRKLGDKNALKWSTSNIALAIFSKLGGIPWLVKPNNNNCLILGIGSAHKRDPVTDKVSKYFAYSVCLDSSGLYKQLEVLADEDNQEHYLEKLQSNLISLLKSDLLENYTSCVLHLPFKIKRDEIKALSQAAQSVKELQFVAIKINTDNKFFGFSSHNTFVPYESNFIKLAKDQYLVWFEGLQFGREVVDKRLASPVHIEFLNLDKENEQDEKGFLQDVLNLSGANWRGFNAKAIPISIYYSQIIASYMEGFERLEVYDEQYLSNERPWFL
jgi:hypothetical protein